MTFQQMVAKTAEILAAKGIAISGTRPPDIPSVDTREILNGFREVSATFVARILNGSENFNDPAVQECEAKLDAFIRLRIKEAARQGRQTDLPAMDWPEVKQEFVAILEAALNAVETGDQVVKPVPRSADAIKLFGLDKPKPEAEAVAAGFLSPAEMAEREANRFKLTPDQQVAENLSKHPAYADLAKPQLIHGTRDGWGTFNPDNGYEHLHRNLQSGVLDTKSGEFIPDGGEPTFGPTLGQTVAAD